MFRAWSGIVSGNAHTIDLQILKKRALFDHRLTGLPACSIVNHTMQASSMHGTTLVAGNIDRDLSHASVNFRSTSSSQ
jgi:hypothetical protein